MNGHSNVYYPLYGAKEGEKIVLLTTVNLLVLISSFLPVPR